MSYFSAFSLSAFINSQWLFFTSVSSYYHFPHQAPTPITCILLLMVLQPSVLACSDMCSIELPRITKGLFLKISGGTFLYLKSFSSSHDPQDKLHSSWWGKEGALRSGPRLPSWLFPSLSHCVNIILLLMVLWPVLPQAGHAASNLRSQFLGSPFFCFILGELKCILWFLFFSL